MVRHRVRGKIYSAGAKSGARPVVLTTLMNPRASTRLLVTQSEYVLAETFRIDLIYIRRPVLGIRSDERP